MPLAILIGAAMIAGAVLYIGGNRTAVIDPNATPTPVAIKDPSTLFGPSDPSLGDAKAKVTIVEFSDFQCPFCRAFFEDTFGQFKKEYVDTGKVRLIYRDFPLSFHPSARPAALAAQCAHDQGKFWEYQDIVFQEQAKKGTGTITFSTADLKAWAAKIGLDTKQFNSCLDSEQHGKEVDADTQAGSAAGVTGTPSFFVNGTLIVGAVPFSDFKSAIDQALKK